MTAAVQGYRWRFGPVLSPRMQKAQGSQNVGGHAGCWVNSYDCGAEDCCMRHHDGRPEPIQWTPAGIQDAAQCANCSALTDYTEGGLCASCAAEYRRSEP